MAFYRARVQMLLKVHDDKIATIELELEFPDFYQPAAGSWLKHPQLDGHCRIAAVSYDFTIGRPIFALAAGAQDASVNLDEWLSQHPRWKIAANPLIQHKDAPDPTDSAPPFSFN